PSLPKGETRVTSPGKPGEKLVRVHVIYHNDTAVKKVPISGQIITPPSPKRILVGTGDKPQPEPRSSGDAGSSTRARPTAGTRSD
ncbi:unnamed protein product, partial [marine sediment metagenome]